jgi:hypothetical protein
LRIRTAVILSSAASACRFAFLCERFATLFERFAFLFERFAAIVVARDVVVVDAVRKLRSCKQLSMWGAQPRLVTPPE